MKIYKTLAILIIAFSLIISCKKKNKTTPPTVTSAVLTTSAVYEITNKTVKCGGVITDAGNGIVNERGVCWGANQFPVIKGNDTVRCGSGTGSFIARLYNLLPNTTYYIRAYATNEVGTAYGDNIKFTTSPFASFTFNDRKIYVYPLDNAPGMWGPAGVVTYATSNSDGKGNTALINEMTGNYAAKTCAGLVAYGYSDWYLPSANELEYMFQTKAQIGGFTNADYWSSTETSSMGATSVDFQTGTKLVNTDKSLGKQCRCVRKD